MPRVSKRVQDFRKALHSVFNTDDGQRVLAYLKEDFLDASVVRDTTEETYYAIGQQDLVKHLIGSLKDDSVLENVATVKYLGEFEND